MKPISRTWMLVVSLWAGCGYQLEGRGVFLPEHIESVAVLVLENNTYERDVEIVLTNAIIEELSRRGGVRIVSDASAADAVLSGAVEEYRFSVLATDDDGRATAYRVFLSAKLTFFDRVRKKPYWQDSLSKTEDFQVEESATSTQVQEREAITNASEDFARTIVTVIFEGF